MNNIKTIKPKQPSRCQCINPLYSFPVCAHCKKVIYNLENQTAIRKRTATLSIELTRLMNEYQVILESYDKQNPQIFISLKTQFLALSITAFLYFSAIISLSFTGLSTINTTQNTSLKMFKVITSKMN